jgi:hypothetical protein
MTAESNSSLNTFGAILGHAIALENTLRDYYASAGQAERAKAADNRRLKLERIRRENVVEITLEPISGLDEANYAIDTADTSAAGQAALEKTCARFYADVAPKISAREAQRALEKCGREHEAYL